MSRSRIASTLVSSIALAAAGCGGGSDGGVTGPPTGAVTVLDVQSKVFTPRCAVSGCHVGPSAPFGLDLSSSSLSAANTVGVASGEVPSFQRVQPSNAADSYLYMKLTADPRILGDPMPLNAAPLSSGDLELIAAWIDGGAR